MAGFPLKVLTMHGSVFDGNALSLLVPTEKGPLLIEPGYTNFIGAISPAGVMRIQTEKGMEYYAVFGGAVDVKRGQSVTVYSEEINYGEKIDLARAIASRDRNLDRIQTRPEGIDLVRAKIKLAKALARIDAKRLSEGSSTPLA